MVWSPVKGSRASAMGHRGACAQDASDAVLEGASGNRVPEAGVKSLLLKDRRPQISPQCHREEY